MSKRTLDEPDSQKYRAFLWCPATESSLVLEFGRGDRVRDVIRVAQEALGDLPFEEGHRHLQGWRLCAEGREGVMVPLHLDEEVPVSVDEVESLLAAVDHSRRARERADILHIFGAVLRPSRSSKEMWDQEHFYEFRGRRFHGEPMRSGLSWPDSGEPVNVRLCVILAIAGG